MNSRFIDSIMRFQHSAWHKNSQPKKVPIRQIILTSSHIRQFNFTSFVKSSFFLRRLKGWPPSFSFFDFLFCLPQTPLDDCHSKLNLFHFSSDWHFVFQTTACTTQGTPVPEFSDRHSPSTGLENTDTTPPSYTLFFLLGRVRQLTTDFDRYLKLSRLQNPSYASVYYFASRKNSRSVLPLHYLQYQWQKRFFHLSEFSATDQFPLKVTTAYRHRTPSCGCATLHKPLRLLNIFVKRPHLH